jgi:hypothetical protein
MKRILLYLTSLAVLLSSGIAYADNKYTPTFPLRVSNTNYLRITNDEGTTKRARCIAVIAVDGTASNIGKTAITDLNITTGANGDCQPGSGVEWIIHGIVHEGAITLSHYDGSNSIPFDTSAAVPTTLDLYQIDFIVEAAPSTPTTSKASVYVDSISKNLSVKDDDGVVKHGVQTQACTNEFVRGISDAGVVNCDPIVAADLPAGSTTQSGIAEAAIASEVDTGTDTARYVTPDALAGSTIFGVKVVQLVPMGFGTNLTTGDGKDYFIVPASLNGMNLIGIRGDLVTRSSSGAVNIDVARCVTVASAGNMCSSTVADMLSTNLTIDADEISSGTAATAAVIDTSNDDVATGQAIRIDIDGAGTGAQGLILTLSFQLP